MCTWSNDTAGTLCQAVTVTLAYIERKVTSSTFTFVITIIFIHVKVTIAITYKQANKINTDTNTKSAAVEKSAIIKKKVARTNRVYEFK